MIFNIITDSLDLRLCSSSDYSSWLLSNYKNWRSYLDAAIGSFSGGDLTIELPGLGYWNLKSFGRRPYEFVLSNSEICDIRIWPVNKWRSAIETQTGQIYLSFRSKFLQFSSFSSIKEFIDKISKLFFSSPELLFVRIARADLACDFSCDGFSWDDLGRFISRSRYRDIFLDDDDAVSKALNLIDQKLPAPPQRITRGVPPTNKADQISLSLEELQLIRDALLFSSDFSGLNSISYRTLPQTLYFGRFTSPIYCRIYNKLASLDRHDKGYMRDIWLSRGWDGKSGVWRIEFSLSGDFLKNSLDISISDENGEISPDLRSFDKFFQSIPQIWHYCTTNWLRFVDSDSSDSNPWRRPVALIWESIQNAWESEFPIIRKKFNRIYDDSAMIAQCRGIALSIAARRSKADFPTEEAFSIFFDLWKYFDSDQFNYDLLRRRRFLGIDSLSQSLFLASA